MPQFESLMRRIERFKAVQSRTRILELGREEGGFPILCEIKKIPCDGIESCPQLADDAQELSRKSGVKRNIKLGNIEGD